MIRLIINITYKPLLITIISSFGIIFIFALKSLYQVSMTGLLSVNLSYHFILKALFGFSFLFLIEYMPSILFAIFFVMGATLVRHNILKYYQLQGFPIVSKIFGIAFIGALIIGISSLLIWDRVIPAGFNSLSTKFSSIVVQDLLKKPVSRIRPNKHISFGKYTLFVKDIQRLKNSSKIVLLNSSMITKKFTMGRSYMDRFIYCDKIILQPKNEQLNVENCIFQELRGLKLIKKFIKRKSISYQKVISYINIEKLQIESIPFLVPKVLEKYIYTLNDLLEFMDFQWCRNWSLQLIISRMIYGVSFILYSFLGLVFSQYFQLTSTNKVIIFIVFVLFLPLSGEYIKFIDRENFAIFSSKYFIPILFSTITIIILKFKGVSSYGSKA